MRRMAYLGDWCEHGMPKAGCDKCWRGKIALSSTPFMDLPWSFLRPTPAEMVAKLLASIVGVR